MVLNYFRTLRNLNRNVLLYLAATSLIGFAVDGGVFSVLFNLYLLRLGFGPEFIGQVAAAGLLAFSIAALPAGSIGERFGQRPVMVVGLVLMSGGGFLLPLAEFLPRQWTEPIIFTLYILLYIGMGLYYVNAVPYVMSISADSERHRAFSMQTALLALAAFTGSLAGGFLPGLFAKWLGVDLQSAAPYRYPLMLATLMILPSIFILFRIHHLVGAEHSEAHSHLAPEAPVTVKSSRFGLYSPVVITIIMISVVRFFQVSGVATANTFFNVYADTKLLVPTSQIGLIVACARLIGVFAALSTPVLVARWGAGPTVIVASLASTFFILPLALMPNWIAAGIGFVGVISISSMRYPAFMIFGTNMVPRNWRGTLAGVGEFAGGMTFAFLALVGGWLAEYQGFSSLFLLGGALALIGTLLFYLWFVMPRNKTVSVPAAEVSSEPLV